MSTSAAQVARLLSLVPYLQRHQGARVDDVAAEFSITPAQLRKDLAVLYMCGLPGLLPGDLIEIDMEAVDGRGVIYLSNADVLARPLRFSAAEVLPLILGLRTLREVAAGEVATSVDSALAKLEGLAGEVAGAAERVSVRVQAASEDIRAEVVAALEAGVRLRLQYDSANRGRTTVRVIDPHSLTVRDGYAYLEAWSEAPEDEPRATAGWRSFRLDRIAAVTRLDEPVQEHSGGPDSGGWLERLGKAAEVRIALAPPASWVAEYYPAAEVIGTDEQGRSVVGLRVADPAWLSSLALRLGPDAEILDPPEAAEAARRAAAEALAQYDAWFPEP